MRSRIVAASTASPGLTNAHSRLRANSTTGPLLPAVANACGCSMLAEANTSAFAPAKISSFSVPEGPYLACTFRPGLERPGHLGQGGAQAAGGMEQDRLGCDRRHGYRRCRQSDGEAGKHHAPGTLALGKNNSRPLIL